MQRQNIIIIKQIHGIIHQKTSLWIVISSFILEAQNKITQSDETNEDQSTIDRVHESSIFQSSIKSQTSGQHLVGFSERLLEFSYLVHENFGSVNLSVKGHHFISRTNEV